MNYLGLNIVKMYKTNMNKTLKCYIRTQKEDLNKWEDTSYYWKTLEMITKIKLINISINSYSYHFLSFLMVKTFKTYPLSKFQVHNTVLLTIIIMLYIRSLELICPDNWKFVPFHQHLPISPPPSFLTQFTGSWKQELNSNTSALTKLTPRD